MQNRYAKSRNEAKYPGLWDELWTAFNFGVAGGSTTAARDLAPRNARANHTGGPSDWTWQGATATQQVKSVGGVGAYFRGGVGSNQDYLLGVSSTTAVNSATVVIDLKLVSNSPGETNTCLTYGLGGTAGSECYPWTDGSLYIDLLHPTRQTIASNGGFDKSKRHILAVSVRCGSIANGWRIFQGGKLLSSATSPATNALAFNAAPRIGGHSFTYYFNGYIYRFYLYGRTLSDQEICRFAPYDNDYDPFTASPIVTRFLFPEQAAGGGVFTSTADLIAAGALFAATATFTAPTYTANAAVASGGAEVSASATVTNPTYTASADLISGGSELSASAAVTNPSYTATSDLISGGAEFDADATFLAGPETYTATAALIAGGSEFASSGTVVNPSYTASAAVIAGGAELVASAEFATVSFTGSAALEAGGATVTVAATFAAPVYTASVDLIAGGAEFESTATFTPLTFTATTSLVAGGAEFAAAATFVAPIFVPAGWICISDATISVARATGTIFVPHATGTILCH